MLRRILLLALVFSLGLFAFNGIAAAQTIMQYNRADASGAVFYGDGVYIQNNHYNTVHVKCVTTGDDGFIVPLAGHASDTSSWGYAGPIVCVAVSNDDNYPISFNSLYITGKLGALEFPVLGFKAGTGVTRGSHVGSTKGKIILSGATDRYDAFPSSLTFSGWSAETTSAKLLIATSKLWLDSSYTDYNARARMTFVSPAHSDYQCVTNGANFAIPHLSEFTLSGVASTSACSGATEVSAFAGIAIESDSGGNESFLLPSSVSGTARSGFVWFEPAT
jgi:hypothetical protein